MIKLSCPRTDTRTMDATSSARRTSASDLHQLERLVTPIALSAYPGRAIGDRRPFVRFPARSPGRRHGSAGVLGLARPAAEQQCAPVPSGALRPTARPLGSA